MKSVLADLVLLSSFENESPGKAEIALRSNDPEQWLSLLAGLGEHAGYHGDYWTRWLSLVRSLARPLSVALGTLTDQQLRWLGVRGIYGGGDRAVGLAAYCAFLRSKKRCGPFEGENTQYLMALLEDGRGNEIDGELSLIRADQGRTPLEDLVMWAHKARAGDAESASKLRNIAHDIDRPTEHQALAAYLLSSIKPSREWAEVIASALGRRVIWEVFFAQFRRVPETWGIPVPDLVRSEAPPKGHEAGTPKYLVEPGESTLVEFASREWTPPRCAGCGHDTPVWFTLRPGQIPELAKWFTWDAAPLLTCTDCGFWMGVNRYQVDLVGRSIELIEAELEGDKKLGKAFTETTPPKPQAAKLRKLTAGAWAKIFERSEPTVVAGRPPRLNDYTWPRCRQCKEWMRYYGSLGTSQGFEGQPAIANDAGYLLHFACIPCSRVTVVPNWT